MTPKQELAQVLRKASSNPEKHAEAQKSVFSEGSGVLNHCGVMCCIAGDKLLRDMVEKYPTLGRKTLIPCEQGLFVSIKGKALSAVLKEINAIDAWVYAKRAYGLTSAETELCFNVTTHCAIHSYLADVFERGGTLTMNMSFSIRCESYISESIIFADGHHCEMGIEEFLEYLEEHVTYS